MDQDRWVKGTHARDDEFSDDWRVPSGWVREEVWSGVWTESGDALTLLEPVPPKPRRILWFLRPKPGQGFIYTKADGSRWFTQDGVEYTRVD